MGIVYITKVIVVNKKTGYLLSKNTVLQRKIGGSIFSTKMIVKATTLIPFTLCG